MTRDQISNCNEENSCFISFQVNGRPAQARIAPDKLLVDFIREDLRLTGTKRGCGYGQCGSCTVLIDGEAVCSCIMLGVELDGRSLETVEGLATENRLSSLQEAFIAEGAVQCGYCTPGMLMSAEALLRKNPQPTEAEISEALRGNFCRCTGYKKIIQAVKAASV